MKSDVILIILFFLTACGTTKQPASSVQDREYFILYPSIRLMEIDPLGHYYILDENDRLSKFDTTGRSIYHVVNNNLGRVHSFDVGNPFKILVFYREQQVILMYDRTLSEIQRFKLADWNFQDVTAVCLSPDNAIWIFDGTNKVLVKLDETGHAILTSDPFEIMNPPSIRPDFIFDADHFLLLKEAGQPVSIFNDFGNYLRSLEIQDELFSISNDFLITAKGSFIYLHTTAGQKEITSFPIKEKLVDKKLCFFANQFYAFDENGVFLVEIKK